MDTKKKLLFAGIGFFAVVGGLLTTRLWGGFSKQQPNLAAAAAQTKAINDEEERLKRKKELQQKLAEDIKSVYVLMSACKADQVKQRFDELIKTYPDNFDIHYQYVHYLADLPIDEHFKTVVAKTSAIAKTKLQRYLVDFYNKAYIEKDREGRLKVLEAASNEFPDSVELLFLQAANSFIKGEIEAVRKCCEEIAENSKASRYHKARAYQLLALTYDDDNENAAKQLENINKSISMMPNFIQSIILRSRIYASRPNTAIRALDDAKRAIEHNPEHAPAFVNMAKVLIQTSDEKSDKKLTLENAASFLQKALVLDPTDQDAVLQYSDLLFGLERIADVEEVMLKFTEHPKNSLKETVRSLYNIVLLVSGKFDEASKYALQRKEAVEQLKAKFSQENMSEIALFYENFDASLLELPQFLITYQLLSELCKSAKRVEGAIGEDTLKKLFNPAERMKVDVGKISIKQEKWETQTPEEMIMWSSFIDTLWVLLLGGLGSIVFVAQTIPEIQKLKEIVANRPKLIYLLTNAKIAIVAMTMFAQQQVNVLDFLEMFFNEAEKAKEDPIAFTVAKLG